ncbi:phosphate acyltransferase PlsX [Candidatus Vondammii sp. HM_W22]|uniref:phosphate acyltransferase PlsX n=1 Tax=Candidatus Vondammii sp. HM_W22 TaxID=2687299 RepID=UPI001F137B6E|nr:phosphate acyltransferase PlsX [Candidatus Vondammii sp. HM_W22]
MDDRITIALDAMGGDEGTSVVVPAAVDLIRQDLDVNLILVGREEVIRQHLDGVGTSDRLRIQPASEEVSMDELPSRALRGKKDSSMRVAINLVKEGTADACVSAGNTGALMATSRFVLKMLPNVDRPAIISALPSIEGRTWMLDLGANVDCSAEHLFQFAVMGSELVSSVDEDVSSPRVGLLNIGQEEIKGNEQVKGAHALLSNGSLNYIGYVEGDDVYKGGVDVVVTDGFIGNVALKSSEGVAKMISHYLKEGFKRNLFTKLAALVAMPVMSSLRQKIDPRRYNGASLLGLKGIVIKSHGGADIMAFGNAIKMAKKAVYNNVPERIAQRVGAHLDKEAGR